MKLEPAAAVLRMNGICKRFGATQALGGVSVEVRAGEALALIGENGAGKSTLMKVLSGAHRADAGSMDLLGRPYAPQGPQQARQAGVAMIYQELNLAPDLSVEDNIMLGCEVARWGWVRRGAQRERVRRVLDLLGHPELRMGAAVRTLSVAAQQLVEIARALVLDARVIVFDEPTSSLTRRDVKHLFAVIRKLKESGLGLVYISHFLEEVREVCERFTVLRDGQEVGSGTIADASDRQIVQMMVGRTVDDLFPQTPHEPGEPLLEIRRICGKRLPQDVTLTLRRGEILGIAGLLGAGRTELLRTLFALDPVRSGSVSIGTLVPAATPRARIAAGLGLVSENRKSEGLAQIRSIADNMTWSRLTPYSRWGWLRLRKRQGAVGQWMKRLEVKARSAEQPVQELSGGNQQKVAIARVLHQEADVLLLDEPTRGIDVGTKAEIYRLMGSLAAEGKGIIFVSSYLPELLAVCDRLAVMARGRVVGVRPTAEWSEEGVMQCAIGGETPRLMV